MWIHTELGMKGSVAKGKARANAWKQQCVWRQQGVNMIGTQEARGTSKSIRGLKGDQTRSPTGYSLDFTEKLGIPT